MAEKPTTTKPKAKKKSVAQSYVRGEQIGARRALLEELFNDLYNDRRNIYIMNFVRGLFFGAGTFLGGTIIVGLVIWLLSLFIQLPVIGPSIEKTRDQIESSQTN